jgi:hypothetical protein
MSWILEKLLAEAVALRFKRYRSRLDGVHNRRRMWYELGFRDGWKAAAARTGSADIGSGESPRQSG